MSYGLFHRWPGRWESAAPAGWMIFRRDNTPALTNVLWFVNLMVLQDAFMFSAVLFCFHFGSFLWFWENDMILLLH